MAVLEGSAWTRTDAGWVVGGLVVIVLVAAGTTLLDTTGTTPGEETVHVGLTVQTPDGIEDNTVGVAENATVFDVLNATHTVSYEQYSFGKLVTGIDGREQNQTHGWLYTVNNVTPETAVDRFAVSSGDQIRFRYTTEQAFE